MSHITRSQVRSVHEDTLNRHNGVGGTTDLISSAPDELAGEVGGLIVTFSGDLDVDYAIVDAAANEFEEELADLGVEFDRNYDDQVRKDPLSGEPSDGPYIELVTEELP